MKDSRSKNTMRNLKSGLFYKAIQIVFPFIIRSVVIHILGAEYLGLDSLFTSILQVLNLAELGFSSAITYSMYKPIVEKDTRTICALLKLYRKFYRIIGLVILGGGLMALPFLKFLIDGDVPTSANIYILYLIYLVNTVLSYMMFAYKGALLNAHQRSDIITNIQSVVNVLQYALQIVALLVFKNYYLFVAAVCVGTIINNILLYYMVKKKYPEYVCEGALSKEQKRDIRKRITGLMVYKICSATRNSLDSIFISSMVGLTAVAIYSNYYMIMIAIVSIMAVLISAATASVGNSIVTESEEKNYRDMNKFNFIYMWVSGWLAICLACLYQPLMKLWMGEENMFGVDVAIMFSVYFYVLKMGDIRALYSDAKGLWYENRFRTIAESILNVILNAVLGYFFGVPGIVIATLISLFIFGFGFSARVLFKYYFVHEKVSRFFLQHAVYALTTIIIGTLTYLCCSSISVDGMFGLILKVLVCVALPNILYLLIYRNTNIFKESAGFIKRLLCKNR